MKVIIPGTDDNVTLTAKIETFDDRVVKCTIYDSNESLENFDSNDKYVGIAKCHPDDQFDKSIGVEVAMCRAIEKRCNTYIKMISEIRGFLGMELQKGNLLIKNKIKKKFRKSNTDKNIKE